MQSQFVNAPSRTKGSTLCSQPKAEFVLTFLPCTVHDNIILVDRFEIRDLLRDAFHFKREKKMAAGLM